MKRKNTVHFFWPPKQPDQKGHIHCGCGWLGKPDHRVRLKRYGMEYIGCPKCKCSLTIAEDRQRSRTERNVDKKRRRSGNRTLGHRRGRQVLRPEIG